MDKKVNFLYDYYWHDSAIEDIYIDRSANRDDDRVAIKINWYDDYKSQLIFNGVYKIEVIMNLGCTGEESISTADIESNGEIEKIHKFLNLKKELKCYVIKTNSPSVIKIIATDFEEKML